MQLTGELFCFGLYDKKKSFYGICFYYKKITLPIKMRGQIWGISINKKKRNYVSRVNYIIYVLC